MKPGAFSTDNHPTFVKIHWSDFLEMTEMRLDSVSPARAQRPPASFSTKLEQIQKHDDDRHLDAAAGGQAFFYFYFLYIYFMLWIGLKGVVQKLSHVTGCDPGKKKKQTSENLTQLYNLKPRQAAAEATNAQQSSHVTFKFYSWSVWASRHKLSNFFYI